MAFKGATLSESFAERRANFSTRISSRGHGFEFVGHEGLNASLRQQIPAMSQALLRAYAEADRNPDAAAQVNRLRGQLGNVRDVLLKPQTYRLADIFMTAARHMLPQDIFDAILTESRAVRDTSRTTLVRDIDAVLSVTERG